MPAVQPIMQLFYLFVYRRDVVDSHDLASFFRPPKSKPREDGK